MAFNKIINGNRSTHGSMKNCISYALRDEKVKDGFVHVTGPFAYDKINTKNCYSSFIEEKRLWNKDSGRMYMHSIVSFHKDEIITVEEAFEFAKDIAENDPFYQDFQTIVAIHQDRDHIHCHFVSNTVSYIDGHKEHHSIKDLKDMMDRTNKKACDLGLSLNEAGKHFNGRAIEPGYITTCNTKKFRLLTNNKKQSILKDLSMAVLKEMKLAKNQDEFITNLKSKHNIEVAWKDNRKHILFYTPEGKKVRDSNLSKTFNIDISKESLLKTFDNNKPKAIPISIEDIDRVQQLACILMAATVTTEYKRQQKKILFDDLGYDSSYELNELRDMQLNKIKQETEYEENLDLEAMYMACKRAFKRDYHLNIWYIIEDKLKELSPDNKIDIKILNKSAVLNIRRILTELNDKCDQPYDIDKIMHSKYEIVQDSESLVQNPPTHRRAHRR